MNRATTVFPTVSRGVLPSLKIDDGTVEAIKWLALIFMTIDHVNKYLLHDAYASMFAIGRLTLPLFGFVLAFNLARPGVLEQGVYSRVLIRLAIACAVATVPFTALGGLGWGWWPVNIMGMLLVSTACIYLLHRGGAWRLALAFVVFIIGGALVEFWWPAIAMCVAAWAYCKRPGVLTLILWIAATASLRVVNHNYWAVGALPLIFAASYLHVHLPRFKHFFYTYYPLHLGIIWALVHFNS